MADDDDGSDNDIDSIILSCLVNGALLVAFLAIFAVLRQKPWGRRFVAPREAAAPAALQRGFFAGVRQVWRDIWDPEKLRPDGTVVVRFCELGLKFSLCGSLLDIVLLPLYASGELHEDGFNRLGLGNLQRGSWRIWGVILGAYALTGIFVVLLRIEWRQFLRLRRENFQRTALGACGRQAAQVQRTVVVGCIPQGEQSAQAVFGYFEGLFGEGSVQSCSFFRGRTHSVHPCQYEGGPGSSWGEAPAATQQESLQLSMPSMPPIAGELVDNVVNEVADGVMQIGRGAQALLSIPSACTTAFVTLGSAACWAQVQQAVLTYSRDWHVGPAPGPQDLLWKNIAVPPGQIRIRNQVAMGLCAFGLLFWSIPVTGIQAWANIENFKWPGIARFQEATPVLYSFVVSYLPVLALIGLYSLLPYLFEFMAATYERHKTKSEVQRIVLNRCFAYQLASLYVTVLSGSVWKSFQEILDKPSNVLGILSGSLPNVAVYFVTFILARVGYSLPLLLLRPWDLCGGWSSLLANSPVRCAMGSEVSSIALVLVIGLTYSYIAPAIFFACTLYFALATLVYRWLFVYVYEPEFDSGGEFWYDLFFIVLLGLFLGTLSLLALAVAYASSAQFVILLPLPFGVLWFGHHCWNYFGLMSKQMPLEDAMKVDRAGRQALPNHDLYRPP